MVNAYLPLDQHPAARWSSPASHADEPAARTATRPRAGAQQDPQLSDLAVATVRELDTRDVWVAPDVGLVTEFTGFAFRW